MMTSAGVAAPVFTGSTPSTGTTPSSICSTPVHLFSPNNPLLQFMQPGAGGYGAQQAQVSLASTGAAQASMSNAYEGIPIFIVPQNGLHGNSVSMAALQRVAELKANLAAATTPQEPKVDTSKHHHIFIGDLSPEIDNRALKEAFSAHGEVSEAKVIRDPQTQKSKGYGFVSFPSKEEAERAMNAMNGQWLGRRAIRTNWATRRPSDESEKKTLTYEQVFNATKADNTSVYVGNVAASATESDLREPFAAHGDITEVRLFKQQGYAFVRYETKESAAHAIIEMNGKEICGQTIRCSWGRVQQNNVQNNSMSPTALLQNLNTFALQQAAVAGMTAPSHSLAQTGLLQSPLGLPVSPYLAQAQYYAPQFYNPALMPQWQA